MITLVLTSEPVQVLGNGAWVIRGEAVKDRTGQPSRWVEVLTRSDMGSDVRRITVAPDVKIPADGDNVTLRVAIEKRENKGDRWVVLATSPAKAAA